MELGEQYVAVSQKACDAVRIEQEVPISHLEKLFLKKLLKITARKVLRLQMIFVRHIDEKAYILMKF